MVRCVRVAVDGDRGLDRAFGFVEFPGGGQNDAEKIEAGEMVRLLRKYDLEVPFRVVQLASLERGNRLRQHFVVGRHVATASVGVMPNTCCANCG